MADITFPDRPLRRAFIAGVGASIPERILTNHDLEQMVETSDEWITERTGIKERRIARDDQPTSDLAAEAATNALQEAGCRPEDLDLIICATISGDVQLPATACYVQDAIGATAPAFDISAACTGFIYGLAIGSQFIQTGACNNVLVIGAEKLSAFTDWTDRATCVLFGDGAGAALLRPCPPDRGLLEFELGTDGKGAELLIVTAGGSRCPTTHATVDAGGQYIRMGGREVFKFAAKALADSSLSVLQKAGVAPSDVALVIPHQANQRITEAATKRLGLPPERVWSNIARYGNTSSASIPIALREALDAGRIQDGDYVVLTGFGGGLTWGACLIKWGP